MRQMLTGAAITGVALGASADDAQAPSQNPPPKPSSTNDLPGEGEWHMQHTKPDAGPSNTGYGVVDPMPPPSRRGCGCHKNDPYEE